MHNLAAVAIGDALPVEGEAGPSKIVDLLCSCGNAFRIRDGGTPHLGPLIPQPTCLDPRDRTKALFAIRREDIQLGRITDLPPRDIDGEPLNVGDFVELTDHDQRAQYSIVGYIDRFTGLNPLRIRKAAVIVVAQGRVSGIIEGSMRVWRRLEAFDSRVMPAYELLRSSVIPDQHWKIPSYTPTPVNHWWILWSQQIEAARASNPGPLIWPPPPDVLAYWHAFTVVAPGIWVDAAYRTVGIAALCRGESVQAVRRVIREAWGEAFTQEHFIIPYHLPMGPPVGYSAPSWSLALKRWPWAPKPPREAAHGT